MKDSEVRQFDGSKGEVASCRFAVVVSQYHETITSKLLDGALSTLAQVGVPDANIVIAHVPGSWELAVTARRLLDQVEAVICLGVVIKGETTHDQYINSMLGNTLGQLSVEYVKPVSFGVLTCNTMEQAVERSGGKVGNKGEEAASAAIQLLQLFQQF